MQPLVSIVIPVFNGADFLRDAIESALAQTYSRKEIIVVNDGSTDGGATESITKSFGGKIRYFFKPNGHVASALNYGIANMAGDYFSWLSHDDVYYPDKIASQIDALERLDGRTVAYGDYESMEVATGVRREHRLPGTRPEHFRWFITLASDIHGCTLLIPRICFRECGVFDTTLRTTQDYDMWFRIAGRFRFVHVPGVVVTARLHPAQGTRQLRGIALAESDALLETFVSNLKDTELAAANQATSARAYGILAASMQARGFAKARDRALALARVRLRDEPLAESHATWLAIAIRLRFNSSIRRLGRPVATRVRSFMRKMRGFQLGQAAQKRFTKIYRHNVFRGNESRSGEGSNLAQTEVIRREIPLLLENLEVCTMLDAPCGDFNWMQHAALPLDQYIGADVVEELVAEDIRRYSSTTRRFLCLDIIGDPLPRADLIFCRDCLVHLNFKQGRKALRNFQLSGAEYLLTTTFPGTQTNADLNPGDVWRTLNLERPPFNLPLPLRLINEGCTENGGAFADKSLGLWLLQKLQLG